MALFFYVGLIFLVMGIAKIAIEYMTWPEKKAKKTIQAPHKHELVCPSCHAKLHPRFRFCPGCGTRVLR